MSGMDGIEILMPVPIREVWHDEAKDFTPWLADNADLLGKVLRMDLVHEETEAAVGSYNADLVFREESTEKLIVVENMFGATDHDHLGKLITYAAGLKVGYAVLLAPEFRDEHRSALNWLNTISTNDFGFFGLVLKVWRIGDSPPAPQLMIDVQPDNWDRSVRVSHNSGLTETQRAYLRFWTDFLPNFCTTYPDWPPPTALLKKPWKKPWMPFPSSRKILQYYPYFGAKTRLRVEAYIYTKDQKVYDQLYDKKQLIEQIVGEELEWDRMDNYPQDSKISFCSSDAIRINDEDRWPEARTWLIQAMGKMQSAFDPILEELDG